MKIIRAARISLLSEAFRGASSGAVGGDTVDRRWWTSFSDPVLAAWVERALEHNHDAAAARQRVREARAGLDTQSSRLWPAVILQGNALRSSSGLPDTVKQGRPETQARRLGADLSWEIDLACASPAC